MHFRAYSQSCKTKKLKNIFLRGIRKFPSLRKIRKFPTHFFCAQNGRTVPMWFFFLLCARMNNLLPPPQKQSTPIQGEKMSISRRSLALVGEVWPYSEKFGLSRRSLTLVGEVWPYPEKFTLAREV